MRKLIRIVTIAGAILVYLWVAGVHYAREARIRKDAARRPGT